MSEEPNNTLDAVKEEVKSSFLSRLNSPFLGAFIVSWLAWNHRLIFVLFSSLEVEDRFKFIDETLYPSTTYSLWMNVGGPLISTLVYIFVLPWVTEWVHEWNLGRARRLKDAERRSAGLVLLDEAETLAFRHARQQSLNQIENLKKEHANARKLLTRWRACSEMQRDPVVGMGALGDFLVSQNFSLASGGGAFQTVHGRIEFSASGDLFSTAPGLFVDVRSWSIDSNGLLFFGANDQEMFKFHFQVLDGSFLGEVNRVRYRLTGEGS